MIEQRVFLRKAELDIDNRFQNTDLGSDCQDKKIHIRSDRFAINGCAYLRG
jgi:hypothetical protein